MSRKIGKIIIGNIRSSENKPNQKTLNLINQGVHLHKVDAPPERKLPTAEQIAEQKKLYETEGPEVDPDNLPKACDGRSILELIHESDYHLKPVETKEPKLPTADKIAEQKKLEGKQ